VARGRNGRAFTGIEEGGLTVGRLGLWRDLRTEEGEDLTGGSGLSAGRERKLGTDSGGALLGRGWLLFWAGIHPRGPFSIFPFFLPFLFLFSDLN
jgi:hypothetical protein